MRESEGKPPPLLLQHIKGGVGCGTQQLPLALPHERNPLPLLQQPQVPLPRSAQPEFSGQDALQALVPTTQFEGRSAKGGPGGFRRLKG